MKLNNKGMTLVEIIISVTLVSIVLVFLFNVMITVKNENNASQSQSKLLINQALIIKAAETDFKDNELICVDYCSGDDVTSITPKNGLTENTFTKCLKFTFNPSKTTDPGYLFYYQYTYNTDVKLNVVGYRRGENKTVRETEIAPSNENGTVTKSCNNNICSLIINLPIKGEDDNDYGINLSYIYNEGNFTYFGSDTPASYGFDIN